MGALWGGHEDVEGMGTHGCCWALYPAWTAPPEHHLGQIRGERDPPPQGPHMPPAPPSAPPPPAASPVRWVTAVTVTVVTVVLVTNSSAICRAGHGDVGPAIAPMGDRDFTGGIGGIGVLVPVPVTSFPPKSPRQRPDTPFFWGGVFYPGDALAE